ncbi:MULTISPECIES: thiol:disulfide interchange protein DsbG [unclassified Halomonas]|uniref:thiol:disulfide interchange protein DsbG n=1 Tax=Halomonadaceae TaxID=28256 RepID=UPI001EF5F8E6|nr:MULTISPECIES: thiol:disulfide interchange protein DsbG [unclassified Halomonas]MCG7577153.1 thiol:disulfide interchange protein DsbG [Halomonas sp. MMH1-48]MCG7604218.1 thiol:disulfide interchange protein DsbG [Halomonas sp. MM17-34]MCG7613467.1 thiol:disulfide interchange protein DsbG [Halomonas sp. MM17-29]MCG7620241.1 thiol:disulfide interchange protein DsbG [Halomonas sp. DSH1-27]
MSWVSLKSLGRVSLLAATASTAGVSFADELPAPIQALANQGLTIHGQFDAPGGMRGFGASVQGQDMAIYLTPDGEHAIIGTLVDGEGTDLTEAQLDEHVRAPLEADTWALLEESHWIQDGNPDAPRVIYTFTDANCPYCRQLWQQTRPWVEAGKVQLRHIMVGILAPNSPALAATILGAEDPSAALHRHSEGDELSPSAQPRDIEEQVYDNNQLFEQLGLYATPTSAFQRETDSGTVRIDRIQGLPSDERFIEMMGSEAP